jgi:hypothetical protein
MMKSIRYGLSGRNTVAGTAFGSTDQSLLLAGVTATGLTKNTEGLTTETKEESNYLAEFDDDGALVRHVAWPTKTADGAVETVAAVASAGKIALDAVARGGAFDLRSFREPERTKTFVEMPEKPVCAAALSAGAVAKVTALDMTGTEALVTVEINVPGQVPVFPCFEIVSVTPQATLVAIHEGVVLKEPTLAGTSRAVFVAGGRVLLARSREDTNTLGQGEQIVTFLSERPLKKDGYQSQLWELCRPADWYGSDAVDGLSRQVGAVVWNSADKTRQNSVWILSRDVTKDESLVHLGTYTAVPKKAN